MKKRVTWSVASGLVVLALLLAACAPAPAKEVAPAVKETAPAVKEVAPAVKEATPAASTGVVDPYAKWGKGVPPRYGGVLNSFLIAPPITFNPLKARSTYGPLPPYEALMEFGPWEKGPAGSGEYNFLYSDSNPGVGPCLATGWEMPEPWVMVYHIRQGVHWPNKAPTFGREMDAYDLEFARRACYNAPAAYLATNYPKEQVLLNGSTEDGIKATDKWTLVVKVQEGEAWTFAKHNHGVGGGANFPPELLKYDMDDWRNMCGTGAFILADYVPGSSLTWQRNPDYWGKDPLYPQNQLPYLDGYKQLIIPDPSTRLAALRTGRLDILGAASQETGALSWEDSAQLLKSNPELHYNTVSIGGVNLFGRVDKPELPWKDIRVRWAVAMAIDNQAIADTYFGGHAKAFNPLDADDTQYDGVWMPLEEYPEVVQKMFGYHPQEAKQLLIEAGYPNGFKAEIITLAPWVDQLSIVAEYWKKNLNIDLDIQVRENAVYNSIKNAQQHKDMIVNMSGGTSYCLSAFNYTRPQRNSAVMSDPEGFELYLAMSKVFFDKPARDALCRAGFKSLMAKAWYTALPWPEVYHFWQPWVKNYYGINNIAFMTTSPLNPANYRFVWLDRDLKQAMTGKR